MIANILSELNTSIDLSRINPEIDFTLANSIQLGTNLNNMCKYDEGAGDPNIQDRMTNRLPPFHVLNGDIAQFDADIVLTIASTEPTYDCEGGRGRIGGIVSSIYTAAQPLAMTTDTYALGDLTASHEIGHLLGGNHEIDMDNWCLEVYGVICSEYGDGAPAHGKGYASNGENWQTMMGGYWGCPFVLLPGQPACVRLNRWSNPAISYQGESTGVANESDMESALEVTAPIVSGWTSYPDPAPIIAPGLSGSPGYCYGFNVLNWTSVNNTTHYQLFESATAAFLGGGSRVSISGGVLKAINIPYNSTRYYKVRACNGNGCSPYSNIKSASYYNGCL